MTAGRDRRLAALRASLATASLDAMLITSLANIRYLSGFSGSSALLVVSATDAVLLTDFRYTEQAKEQAGDVMRVVIEPASLWSRLWALLPTLDIDVMAFESAHVTHADYQRFVDSGSRWQWRPSVNLVETFREQKDAAELDHIRDAVRMAETALARTIDRVRVGMTEMQIGGTLEWELREAGSEAFAFETIVATGFRSALPHARCSSRQLQMHEFLLIDFGAVSGGYVSDITRTFVMGKATAEMKDIYDVVRESNATASGAIRAGMRGKDADALARGYIERRGWGDEFGHSLGHGIGLEIHEAPRLSKSSDAPLPVGSVVTIEPGIYRPKWGGVRIEDDVWLNSDGAVVLTSFARDLIEL